MAGVTLRRGRTAWQPPGVLRLGACLSLTGRFARFGRQAASGLEAWRRLAGEGVELRVEDDGSDPGRLVRGLTGLRCDLLLGPYSTGLMRAAAEAIDGVLWNHGGAGDDVQALRPGRIVSVLSPASRYAEPFLLVRDGAPLWVAYGPGEFGRQVAAGAGGELHDSFEDAPAVWDLLCAGRFEDDVALVEAARAAPRPPRALCSIAAGVRDFASAVADPDGVFGIAQWFPGAGGRPEVGPTEAELVAAYGRAPDYPAVQAAAAAALAVHCARVAGSVEPRALWAAAAGLDTTTLFGRFGIDPVTGAQVRHETVLVRWRGGSLGRVPGPLH